MKLLSCILALGITARISGGDTGDFDIHTGSGTSDYEFVYDRSRSLLLTIHADSCYFARIKSSDHDHLLYNNEGQIEDLVKYVINSERQERKLRTTLDEAREMFHETPAYSKCLTKDIYIIQLDYVECDFEQDLPLCAWTENPHGNLQWKINKGSTPTLLTGPDADHTYGNQNQGHYLYLEANDGSPGEVADLISTMLPFPTHDTMCLRFWYNMYGTDVGQLEVLVRGGRNVHRPEEVSLWTKTGNQGHGWQEAQVAVSGASPNFTTWHHHMQLSIRATRGAGIEGDIAIDDISSTPGSCPTSVLDCSFDDHSNLCHWSQVNVLDQMDWWKHRGPTRTNGTGPDQSTNSADYYLYMEGDSGHPGDTADLQSPILHLSGPICLSFRYFMYGSGVGELDVVLLDRSTMSERVLWNRAGDQGYGWITAHVPIMSQCPDTHIPLQLLFRATRGRSVTSDIAIDRIVGQSGTCQQYIAGTPIIG